jgi:hypothetical protein
MYFLVVYKQCCGTGMICCGSGSDFEKDFVPVPDQDNIISFPKTKKMRKFFLLYVGSSDIFIIFYV